MSGSGIKRKGLVGYHKSRDKDKCPVNDCNAVKLRGYDIKKHFRSKANLLALDQANSHQSELRKKFKASDSVAVPDEFLKNLLVSDSEKDHTIYLFQNGFSSISLPDCDSVGFKCQQKTLPVPDMFKFVGPKPGKVMRISESPNVNAQNQSVSTNSQRTSDLCLILWIGLTCWVLAIYYYIHF